MSANDSPHVRVTMIGNSRTGKTTYLVGMYAEMSVGISNYFLTSDHDTHRSLTGMWSALVERGLLPTTTTESKTYAFTFRYGVAPLLSLEWIDYRGGAVTSGTDDEVTKALLARVVDSDSLYFTLDGELLASVLAGETGAERALRTTTALYNNMLAEILDQRREANLFPPSIVLLVTKNDLLIEHVDGGPEERRRKIGDWIAGRFPQVFDDDRDVAICTVSLGELGTTSVSKVEANLVDPIRVHKPMVFTLFSYYRRAALVFEAQAAEMAAQHGRGSEELAQLRGRFLGRGRARELEAQVGQSAAAVDAFRQIASECWNRVRVLEHELLDVDTYVGGQRLEAA
jgi:hypothetical protein